MTVPIDPTGIDINEIIACQRNRFPVLLIDRITEIEAGTRAVGKKCFTYNEWYFQGHFDDEPNVPGFILVECLTQTFIMTFLCLDEYKGMKTSFVSLDNVRFRRKIVPGDVLTIEARLRSFKRGIATGTAEGCVDGHTACRADLVVALPAVLERLSPKT